MQYQFEQLKPLREKSSQEYQPEEEQILQYADYIGIELPHEKFLLHIAKQGIVAHLPEQWQACSTPDGQIVYRNNLTRAIQEEHPLDEYFREKVKIERTKFQGVATLLQNQNQDEQYQEEFSYEQGSLLTIPEEKSDQHSFDKSQSLDRFVHPSMETQRLGNNQLRPESGSQLLNHGMHIFSSSAFSQQQISRDILLNNLSNRSDIEGTKYKSGLIDSQKDLYSLQVSSNRKAPENRMIESDQRIDRLTKSEKMNYLETLKKQVENIRALRSIKEQLLKQTIELNQLKTIQITKCIRGE